MQHLIKRVRSWFAPPALRLTADKRRLEGACMAHGTSQSVAKRITSTYFAGDK